MKIIKNGKNREEIGKVRKEWSVEVMEMEAIIKNLEWVLRVSEKLNGDLKKVNKNLDNLNDLPGDCELRLVTRDYDYMYVYVDAVKQLLDKEREKLLEQKEMIIPYLKLIEIEIYNIKKEWEK